jgi:hypothetical protein
MTVWVRVPSVVLVMKPKKLTHLELINKQYHYFRLLEWVIHYPPQYWFRFRHTFRSFETNKYDRIGKTLFVAMVVKFYPCLQDIEVDWSNEPWYRGYYYYPSNKMRSYSSGQKGYRHRSSKGYWGRYHGRCTPNTATRMKIKRELLKIKQLFINDFSHI